MDQLFLTQFGEISEGYRCNFLPLLNRLSLDQLAGASVVARSLEIRRSAGMDFGLCFGGFLGVLELVEELLFVEAVEVGLEGIDFVFEENQVDLLGVFQVFQWFFREITH